MELPLNITMKSEDIGATQRVTFYLNGMTLVRYKTRTRHEENSLEYAEADFRRFIAEAFQEHLIKNSYEDYEVELMPDDDDDYYGEDF